MLNVYEELFLLSLIEKKNSVAVSSSLALPYALAGAMIFELVRADRIKLDIESGKRVIVVNASPVENVKLTSLLEKIASKEHPKKLSYWMSLVGSHAKDLTHTIISTLIETGILQEEEKRYLWVIPYTEYSQKNASAKYLAKEHLRSVVLGGEAVDERSIALLSLLKVCDMLGNIFTNDEIKAADKRIKDLTKDEAVGQTVIEILDEITTAALMSTMASTTA